DASASAKKLVILAGMPESSHMDVRLWLGIKPKSCHSGIGKLPSLALDTGIPASMTALAETYC
ncbi:MAG: hypothetical protein Q8L79_09545, partial [Methylobacter sp.]|uniref:hypothetical protein n=1 Tax=Methylobacter sp. TaxID=2051955 RepID=UPI00273205DC